MPDIDRRQKLAAELVLKSMQTGKSVYANEAIKIANLKDAYAKLGVLDRVVMNLGRMDLQAKGVDSQDPATLYRAGQTYLWEYFNRELMDARTRRGELELKQKPLFKNIDLAGRLLGPSYTQGKRDWTTDEAQALFSATYQMGLLALSGKGGAEQAGAGALPQIVKEAKDRVDAFTESVRKKYSAQAKGGAMSDQQEAEMWFEIVQTLNQPGQSFLKQDWTTVYNFFQAIKGAAPDGEAVWAQISRIPKAQTGPIRSIFRAIFKTGNYPGEYQTPPVLGGAAGTTVTSPAAQAQQQAAELGARLAQ